MVIEEIPNPQAVSIYGRDGKKEKLVIPKTDNDMVYEIREFVWLVKEQAYNHRHLNHSELTLELMDEVRRQQGIVFPADKEMA